MKCRQLYRYLTSNIDEKEFKAHCTNCKDCDELFSLIESTMNVFDEEVEIPAGLVKKGVTLSKQMVEKKVQSRFDINKYFQIAAVFAAAVFLGTLLGQNANSEIFVSSKEKKEKSINAYRKSIYFDDESSGLWLFR